MINIKDLNELAQILGEIRKNLLDVNQEPPWIICELWFPYGIPIYTCLQ